MKIKCYQFRDFKSFEFAQMDLDRPLTLLIGPNGSGKTNLIEAIEILAHIASGQPLHTITDIGRGGALEVRGGLQSCVRLTMPHFTLGLIAVGRFEGAAYVFQYQVSVRAAPTPEIEAESLQVGDRVWFDANRRADGGIVDVRYDNFAQGGNKPSSTTSAAISVLSQYASLATRNKKGEACAKAVDDLRQQLHRAYVADPSARRMRSYDRIGNTSLLRDGSNLSSVLYGLSQGSPDDKATLGRIVDRIRQLPEEPFVAIDFETTRLQDVIFGFKTRQDGPLLDARLLSDGTLRTLAVITALETCEAGSRLVIEEFDNGVHPSRLAKLTEAMVETARRRHLNMLVTTHNPATLDSLSHAQLAGVLVCHWEQEEGVAALTPLLDVPRVDELLERGRLGDLVTRRIVETYLVPATPAERADQARAWLDALP